MVYEPVFIYKFQYEYLVVLVNIGLNMELWSVSKKLIVRIKKKKWRSLFNNAWYVIDNINIDSSSMFLRTKTWQN